MVFGQGEKRPPLKGTHQMDFFPIVLKLFKQTMGEEKERTQQEITIRDSGLYLICASYLSGPDWSRTNRDPPVSTSLVMGSKMGFM